MAIPPTLDIGFPSDWALLAAPLKRAVQCLRSENADSYNEDGQFSAIEEFLSSLESGQIRAAAPTQSQSARTRAKAKPAPPPSPSMAQSRHPAGLPIRRHGRTEPACMQAGLKPPAPA